MKDKRLYIFLLAVYVVLMVLIGLFQPKKIDWTPTFASSDKIPYGSYVLRQELDSIFPKGGVRNNEVPFYNFYNDNEDAWGNFIIINSETQSDKLDARDMCEFVAEGNNVFISSTALPAEIEDSLGIRIHFFWNNFEAVTVDSSKKYNLNFTNEKLKTENGFGFRQDNMAYEILDADSSSFVDFADTSIRQIRHIPRVVLGTDKDKHVNFAMIPYGDGNFFIHTYPFAFTNYHVLKNETRPYVEKCFSYLPDQQTFWDEYYKPYRKMKAQTPMRYILSVPSYKWAYFTALAAMFLYVLFFSKRVQRIIPIILPYKNLSLEFTRTIGTLYFQQRDHTDLANKKMTYFLEKVRNAYFLSTNVLDDVFVKKLAQKSNVNFETANAVFENYNWIKKSGASEEKLIAFNKAIEKFYFETGLNNK